MNSMNWYMIEFNIIVIPRIEVANGSIPIFITIA